MNFKFVVKEILPQLIQVASVVKSKNTLPILDDVLFSMNQDKVVMLTASDGETWLSMKANLIECDDAFTFCINARNIVSALKNLGENTIVTCRMEEPRNIRIEYVNGFVNLPYDDSNEFPKASEIGGDYEQMTIRARNLSNAISSVMFAIGEDDLRPVLNGVYLNFEGDSMSSVGTDGQNLAVLTDKNVGEVGNCGFIFPKKPALTLVSLIEKCNDDEMVKIEFNDSFITISKVDFKISARLVEGRYPNYKSVIPQENGLVAKVEKEKLISCLKRIMPFGNEKSCLVSLSFTNDSITVSSENVDFSTSATEKIPCEFNNDSFVIGFNGNMLAQSISNLQGDNFLFKMKTQSNAALIEPEKDIENITYKSIIMPMLLN